jgi:RNA polymerase sigma-70 factor (ECF subfamily)
MSATDPYNSPPDAAPWRFASTHWSLVLAARERPSPEAEAALTALCRVYWYPLYAYARRHLSCLEDAQDLTQEFFAQLLEKDYLQAADPQRGKFRSFLLTAFKHFLAKERDRASAQKRGGGRRLVSLDFDDGERRFRLEPADHVTPETVYERRWALTLLEQTLAQLRQEFVSAGKHKLFECLKGTLTGESTATPYSRIAQELGMSEQGVKVAVHRLRRRYQELIRGAIAQTVTSAEDIDDELRSLFAAVRTGKSGKN